MKQLLLATVAVLLAASATAEECVSKTEPHEGTSYETCMARVDDVIRVSVDGYVAQHYIVQYRDSALSYSTRSYPTTPPATRCPSRL